MTEISEAECNALVALYTSAGGTGWTNNTNWLETDTPSDWYGVTVTGTEPDRHVTYLNLAGNNLVGIIPTAIGDHHLSDWLLAVR